MLAQIAFHEDMTHYMRMLIREASFPMIYSIITGFGEQSKNSVRMKYYWAEDVIIFRLMILKC